MHNHLDRNLTGYGAETPDPQWPGEARIAVSFVLNYEEGGENTILNGDPASEVFLCDTLGGPPSQGGRDLSIESQLEYGSRAGFWRIMRLFGERNMRFTSWAVGRALELNPAAGKAMAEGGHEVASHGWRWINYKDFTLEQELDHIRKTVAVIKETVGKPPVGWYTGRFGMHTLSAVIKHGGFLYSSDSYNDDLPYWVRVDGTPHLIIPYTLEVNDMKFGGAPGGVGSRLSSPRKAWGGVAVIRRRRGHAFGTARDPSVRCADTSPRMNEGRISFQRSACCTQLSMPAAFIAPDWRATSLPCLKRIMVGIAWMPNRPASACWSSVLPFASRAVGSRWPAA